MVHKSFPLLFVCAVLCQPLCASAAVLYESGTLGPTGIPQGSVDATNVTSFAFTGVRFQFTQAVLTTEVGGHFVGRNDGNFFGAIIQLDNADDLPDSGDLSTPDVLGVTILQFPIPSNEAFGHLELSLDSGWYALVFGSGLFGTTGNGTAVRNGTDINDPDYIAFQPGDSTQWGVLSSFFDNHRFVVQGVIVPEPSGALLAHFVLIALFCRMKRPKGKCIQPLANDISKGVGYEPFVILEVISVNANEHHSQTLRK